MRPSTFWILLNVVLYTTRVCVSLLNLKIPSGMQMVSASHTNSQGWTTQMKVVNEPSNFTRCHLPTTSSNRMTRFTLRIVSLTPIVSCKRIWSRYTNLARVPTWEKTTFAIHFLGLAYLFWLWQAMLTNVDKVHRLKLINLISVKMSRFHNINSRSM